MSYLQAIERSADDPEQLEIAYREAVKAGGEAAFAEAIEANYAQSPDDRLLAAWHHRLAYAAAKAARRVVAWGWALPLAALNGVLLWLLSDDQQFKIQATNPLNGQVYTMPIPTVALLAAPICALLIGLFLTLAGRRRWGRVLAVLLGLAAGPVYVLLLFPQIWPRLLQEQYLGLMVLHLALLAWAGVGMVALARRRDRKNQAAFLAKSLEAFVVAGLLAICGGLLAAITFALFNALGIGLPDWVVRLFAAGGGGLIAVVAVALVYDPALEPAQQSFDEGLSKLVALLLRLLLPLSVAMLLVYLCFIPFNWREPFQNRDVLLAFNAMLFAAVALLVAVTPLDEAELGEKSQTWLRRGVMALAALALIISLYALAAILYRTASDRLTPNRLLFIGWNIVNIAVLITLLIQQARAGRPRWLQAMHSTFAIGVVLYLAWSVAGLLTVPWLFRGVPADVANLPPSVQQIVYERADPILLKCTSSAHIYLLQNGQKHWIKDIPTMTAQGYRWSDVQTITCFDLRLVPDGETIPPDAGPPPQP
jgi:MFS family permease